MAVLLSVTDEAPDTRPGPPARKRKSDTHQTVALSKDLVDRIRRVQQDIESRDGTKLSLVQIVSTAVSVYLEQRGF